jgi:hypothetical protein
MKEARIMMTSPVSGEAKQQTSDFDAAAAKAQIALRDLNHKSVMDVAVWWYAWYMTAGHKRLGRLLVDIARQEKRKQTAKE